MANTYVLIASNTLSASAASVTFSSIPSTYTDLVVRWSARSDVGGSADNIGVTLNGTTANYSATELRGNGSTAISGRTSSAAQFNLNVSVPSSGYTANTFSNNELYIPNYTSSTNKPVSAFNVSENNATTGIDNVFALLWSNTASINSISFFSLNSANFVSGSNFYLYGIKNS